MVLCVPVQGFDFELGRACIIACRYDTTSSFAGQELMGIVQELMLSGEGVDKQSLENCMNTIALGLSLVMAGTGDLETFSLLRGKLPSSSCAAIH